MRDSGGVLHQPEPEVFLVRARPQAGGIGEVLGALAPADLVDGIQQITSAQIVTPASESAVHRLHHGGGEATA
ncbi:MAG: hypothetical protein ABIP33_12135, partial [Pseudolysinimonas sp.]